MHLPQQLQHFPHPTLIVSADSVMAKLFLVGGDSLEELDGIALPRERKQDSEGSYASSGSRVMSPDSDVDDGPRFHRFIHLLVEQTVHLVNEHAIAHLHLVMPPKVEHAFSSALPAQLNTKLGQRLHLDLMKATPLEIIERLLQD